VLLQQTSRSGMTPVSAIIAPDKNVQIVVPELRAYIDLPRGTKDMPKADPIREMLTILDEKGCEVLDFGRSAVGDYQTRVFCVSDSTGKRRDAFVEIAPQLANLIVSVDFGDDWTAFDGPLRYKLSNVALEVSDELFEVPTTYTKFSR
jgi:hypothetical protein